MNYIPDLSPYLIRNCHPLVCALFRSLTPGFLRIVLTNRFFFLGTLDSRQFFHLCQYYWSLPSVWNQSFHEIFVEGVCCEVIMTRSVLEISRNEMGAILIERE